MAFRPVNKEEGRLVSLPAAASVAFVKGHACFHSAVVDATQGYMTIGLTGTAVNINYIADETVTTGASVGDLVRFYKVDPSVLINADCDGVVSQTDVGTAVPLLGAASVNPDGTGGTDLFYIESADTSNGNAVETTTIVNGFFLNGISN